MRLFGSMQLKRQITILIGFMLIVFVSTQLFYYVKFYLLTQERAKVYTSNIMNQLSDSIQDNSENIRQIAYRISYTKSVQEFLSTKDAYRKIQLQESITDIFNNLHGTNRNIYDIFIVNNNGNGLSYAANYNYVIFENLKENYNFTGVDFKRAIFSSTYMYEKNVMSPKDAVYYFSYIMPIFLASEGADPNTKIGACIVVCDTGFIQNSINSLNMPDDSMFAIIDGERKIIAANNSMLRGGLFQQNTWPTQNDPSLLKKYIYQNDWIGQLDWNIVSIISIQNLTRDMQTLQNSIIVISLFLFFVLVCIGIILNRSIANPVYKLTEFMKQFGSTNAAIRLRIKEKNEIGQLSTDINHMLDKMDEITNSLVETQKKLLTTRLAQKQTELNALQSQINPHFLYNTLDCVKSIAQIYEVDPVVRIAYSMSKIFRYCIKEKDIVTFREEIECVNDYLNIMSIRFENRFRASFSIDNNIFDKHVPKMILQPIVENAIYHGLEKKYGEGLLQISGFLCDRMICITVSDNGIGIDDEQLEILRQTLASDPMDEIINYDYKRGLGIANINNRIRILYGINYGITIQSGVNEGTTVMLRIPELPVGSPA